MDAFVVRNTATVAKTPGATASKRPLAALVAVPSDLSALGRDELEGLVQSVATERNALARKCDALERAAKRPATTTPATSLPPAAAAPTEAQVPPRTFLEPS